MSVISRVFHINVSVSSPPAPRTLTDRYSLISERETVALPSAQGRGDLSVSGRGGAQKLQVQRGKPLSELAYSRKKKEKKKKNKPAIHFFFFFHFHVKGLSGEGPRVAQIRELRPDTFRRGDCRSPGRKENSSD